MNMKKVSFSIPSAKPQSKPQSVEAFNDASTAENDTDATKHPITEFDPSKPLPSKFTITPLQNQWNPKPQPQQSPWRRTPEETERRRKLKLRDDLRRLPDDPGFEDVSVQGFGEAILAGYGWTQGMGIGKNAKEKEDVNVVQFKGRASREGLGFVTHHPALAPTNHANLDHSLKSLQL